MAHDPFMTKAHVNNIEIEYDLVGLEDRAPLLLVSGHGAQLVGWDDDFCQQLAERGFLVIRYDNRDVGLSSKIEGPDPDPIAAFGGDVSSAVYTLADMADDGAALLDHLGIAAGHIVGASLGGMIAQWIAIRHPQKTLSLVSIMSTTGDRSVGMPTPEAMEVFLRPPALSAEESIERAMDSYRRFVSPDYPLDEARVRSREERQHRRSWYPKGAARQLVAIIASGDWTTELKTVTAPTLVIHGDADPIITPDGAEATARAIPGAELMTIPGMAHELPEELWPQIFDAIARNARRAGSDRAPESRVKPAGRR